MIAYRIFTILACKWTRIHDFSSPFAREFSPNCLVLFHSVSNIRMRAQNIALTLHFPNSTQHHGHHHHHHHPYHYHFYQCDSMQMRRGGRIVRYTQFYTHEYCLASYAFRNVYVRLLIQYQGRRASYLTRLTPADMVDIKEEAYTALWRALATCWFSVIEGVANSSFWHFLINFDIDDFLTDQFLKWPQFSEIHFKSRDGCKKVKLSLS